MEDHWNAELWLHVISYLNVRDAGRLALQSRRCYYLVDTFRNRTDLHVASLSSTITERQQQQYQQYQLTAEQLCQGTVEQLQSRPSLALAVSSASVDNMDLCRALPRYLPTQNGDFTVVLGAVTDSIQTMSSFGGGNGDDDAAAVDAATCEFQSYYALLMLAGLNSSILDGAELVRPFYLPTDDIQDNGNASDDFFASYCNQTFESSTDWSVFIVFVCGIGKYHVNALAASLQDKYPQATIVGGVCNSCYVSMPIDREKFRMEHLQDLPLRSLQQMRQSLGDYAESSDHLSATELAQVVHDLAQTRAYTMETLQGEHPQQRGGICGVAMAGSGGGGNHDSNIPVVRSVVSRGFESLTCQKQFGDGTPQPHTSFYVHHATYHTRAELEHDPELPQEPFHLIHSVVDRDCGKVYNIRDMPRVLGGRPEQVGFRYGNHARNKKDGFDLYNPQYILSGEMAIFGTPLPDSNEDTVSSLLGANIDFFKLNGQACLQDMDHCLEQLQKEVSDKEVLGGLFIGCNGRGPEAGALIEEEMADASRLARAFPQVPFVGIYAGGELGATVCPGRESVFAKDDVCLQGYTAIVLLFVKPQHRGAARTGASFRMADDGEEQIKAFVQSKLRATSNDALARQKQQAI